MSGRAVLKPVVVTRAEGSDGPLSRELRGMGLQVLSWPAVKVGAADPSALSAALAAILPYGIAIIAVEAALRPEPQIALGILQDTHDGALGETVARGQMLEI